MTSALITAALAIQAYSLWVRRDTWRSDWEIGATAAIALEVGALVLMSPWASLALGPPLYRLTGLWNVQTMLGHLCLIAAIAAIIYHVLIRLADEAQVHVLFHTYVVVPLRFGVLLLLATFVIAREGYHHDLLTGDATGLWLTSYWLIVGGLVIYLSGYVGRLLLILRTDPRAAGTVDFYLVSGSCGVIAASLQMATAWTRIDVTVAVWAFVCLAVSVFAYGSARSWQAKVAWFASRPVPPPRPVPPAAA